MANTIKITLPLEADMEFFRQVGHIFFKMEDLANNEFIARKLISEIRSSREETAQPKNNEDNEKRVSIRDLNKRSEL